MKKITIAIDGPAGAGKSTIAKQIADGLGIMYVDTGAMYRAVTFGIIRNGIDISDKPGILKFMECMNLELSNGRVFLNGEDITEDIRKQQVGSIVSYVSAIPEVRQKLVEIQREMARDNSVVMDGRDIGTNVLKHANIKIFLTASVDERAKRRYTEMKSKGYEADIDKIKTEIKKRDSIDSSREINPLMMADDAILVDTTNKTIEDVVTEILCIVKER